MDDNPCLRNTVAGFYSDTTDYRFHDYLTSDSSYSYKIYARFLNFHWVSGWKAYSAKNHNPAVITEQFFQKISVFPKKPYNTEDDLIPDEWKLQYSQMYLSYLYYSHRQPSFSLKHPETRLVLQKRFWENPPDNSLYTSAYNKGPCLFLK